jgi:Mrp family chromosome partitioning ATPase
MADISPAIAVGPFPNAARSSAPATTVAGASRVEANDSPAPASAEIPVAAAASAAGLLERLRRGLAPGDGQTAAPPPQGGWLGRLRPARTDEARAENEAASPPPGNMPVLRTNDLRHYLNQRLAASAAEAANDSPRKGDATASRADADKVGPVLKSLDAVLNHVLAAGKGGAPRALLVAGATAKLDATAEAIAIARALAKREQVVLVDITRGPASISGALGLPRTPGLTDLVAGRAGFEDVVRIDDDSALQVISAGNPKLSGANDDENERFARLFEALTQTYDSVVLHADREAVRQLTPALKFELPIMVAVLPAGAGDSGVKADLAEFSALGCPVLVYEQTGKQPRSRFFERAAAG